MRWNLIFRCFNFWTTNVTIIDDTIRPDDAWDDAWDEDDGEDDEQATHKGPLGANDEEWAMRELEERNSLLAAQPHLCPFVLFLDTLPPSRCKAP